jgi:hypothetical protein
MILGIVLIIFLGILSTMSLIGAISEDNTRDKIIHHIFSGVYVALMVYILRMIL